MNETIRKNPWPVAFVLSALFFVAWNALADLEPPGPPSEPGTMERVIYAADMPLTITTPGTYRFGQNIVAPGAGITINASNVTLDLAGFAFSGGAGNGIVAGVGTSSLVVKNGTVHGWPGTGVLLLEATASQIVQIRAYNNGILGIAAGPGSVVSGCTAHANGGIGIRGEAGSTIVDSAANGNLIGFSLVQGSTIANCSAEGNDNAGIAATASVVTGCAAANNLGDGISVTGSVVSNCTAHTNGDSVGDHGFDGTSNTVTDCTAVSNFENGFNVVDHSRLEGNLASSNGANGVRLLGTGNRIEHNNLVDNATGIFASSSGNFIIGNSASGNATNYSFGIGNSYGAIIAGSTGFTSNNSYANFTY